MSKAWVIRSNGEDVPDEHSYVNGYTFSGGVLGMELGTLDSSFKFATKEQASMAIHVELEDHPDLRVKEVAW